MEQMCVPEQSNRLAKILTGACLPTDGLTVTLVYEDAVTRPWAKEIHETLSKHLVAGSVRATWWNMNEFNAPGVLAGAVSTAMRADLIVVAVRGTEGLSLPFYVWVESWLPHRLPRAGGLIAMVSGAENSESTPERVKDYFKAVAREGRLNFWMAERLASSPNGAPESEHEIFRHRNWSTNGHGKIRGLQNRSAFQRA